MPELVNCHNQSLEHWDPHDGEPETEAPGASGLNCLFRPLAAVQCHPAR